MSSWTLSSIAIVLLACTSAHSQEVASAQTPAAAAAAAAEDDAFSEKELSAQEALLEQAAELIAQGETAKAISIADSVIALFEAKYPTGSSRWMVARSPEEALNYMTLAIAEAKSDVNHGATALSTPEWPGAYFIKGYALVELGDNEAAKDAFGHALALMPLNARYLSELGNIYQGEKNWPKALDLYTRAEDAARFSSDESRTNDLTRAKRGMGFVLVELHRFDEAEKKYNECLALDPNDDKSKQELEYVRYARLQ